MAIQRRSHRPTTVSRYQPHATYKLSADTRTLSMLCFAFTAHFDLQGE